MVWAPLKATISCVVNPFAAKREIMSETDMDEVARLPSTLGDWEMTLGEGAAGEGEVDVGVALGGVEGGGGDEDGGVAAFDHAVMEEEAEGGGGGGGVFDLLGAYDVPHDGFEGRA